MKKDLRFISAELLKVLAMALMLMDHMWATVIPGNDWMTFVGRLAFPIFAYQVVEGYKHTSDMKKYKKRLLIFALISEIPFNLMCESSVIYPFHQNVCFTMLLGVISMQAVDKLVAMADKVIDDKEAVDRGSVIVAAARNLLYIFITWFGATVLMVDYGRRGVMLITAMYMFFIITDRLRAANMRESVYGNRFDRYKVIELILDACFMIYLFQLTYAGRYIPVTVGGFYFEFHTQAFAVLSIIFIGLYNGRCSANKRVRRVVQYGCYIFYPLHMLVLSAVRYFFL